MQTSFLWRLKILHFFPLSSQLKRHLDNLLLSRAVNFDGLSFSGSIKMLYFSHVSRQMQNCGMAIGLGLCNFSNFSEARQGSSAIQGQNNDPSTTSTTITAASLHSQPFN